VLDMIPSLRETQWMWRVCLSVLLGQQPTEYDYIFYVCVRQGEAAPLHRPTG